MFKRNSVLFYFQIFALIAFLVLSFVFPWATLRSVIMAFGILLIVQGIFTLVNALIGLGIVTGVFLRIVYGLLSLGLGVLIFFLPELSIVAISYILGGWILISGILDVIEGVALRKKTPSEFLLILNGVLSILFSLFVFIFPASSAVGFIWFIGVYLIIWVILYWSQTERIRNNEE